MFTPLPETNHRRRIYLMRHGEVSYFNEDGSPVKEPNLVRLTNEGRQQALSMSGFLKNAPIDRAICSGLIRTKETTKQVLDKRNIKIEELESLREVQPKSFVSVPANLREEELVYAFENAKRPGACYGNGETFTDFASRISTSFTNIVLQENWSSLLIVAHDGVNRIILSTVASNFSANTDQILSLMGGFEQDTCCLNIIDLDTKDTEVKFSRIKAMNITPDNLTKEGNYFSSMERIFRPYAHSYIH